MFYRMDRMIYIIFISIINKKLWEEVFPFIVYYKPLTSSNLYSVHLHELSDFWYRTSLVAGIWANFPILVMYFFDNYLKRIGFYVNTTHIWHRTLVLVDSLRALWDYDAIAWCQRYFVYILDADLLVEVCKSCMDVLVSDFHRCAIYDIKCGGVFPDTCCDGLITSSVLIHKMFLVPTRSSPLHIFSS